MDISNIKNDVISYWFENNESYLNKWFDKSCDDEIKQLFDHYYNDDQIISFYNNLELISNDVDNLIALIIIYDQFPRNLFRNDIIKRKKYDNYAIAISEYIINNNLDLQLSIAKKFFVILPLRHTFKLKYLDMAIKRIKQYYNFIDENDKPYLNKFYQTTLSNYTNLVENICVDMPRAYMPEQPCPSSHAEGIYARASSCKNNNNHKIDYVNYYDLFDEKCKKYLLKSNNELNSEIENTEVFKQLIKWINNRSNLNIGISLSGGVDSMVILHCLKYMESKLIINKVIAIHVYYGNRESSINEFNFLIDYCKYFNVPIYYRQVYWMKRDDNIDRNFYELETRKIRFNLYNYVITNENLYGICLGHHRDDISENIFTNIVKNRDIFNIKAMEKEMLIDNVLICRPLLDITKNTIFDYSEKFNIMYFLDSTPDWSCRGTMRRQIFPLMDNFFGNTYDKLYIFGNMITEWSNVIQNNIIEPIYNSIKYYNLDDIYTGIRFDNNSILPKSFYINLFLIITRKIGYPMIKNNITDEFYSWLNKKNNNEILFMQFNNKQILCYNIESKIYLILISNIKYILDKSNIDKYIQFIEFYNNNDKLMDLDDLLLFKINIHNNIKKNKNILNQLVNKDILNDKSTKLFFNNYLCLISKNFL